MLGRALTRALRTAPVRRTIQAWCDAVAPADAPWFDGPSAGEKCERFIVDRGIPSAESAYLRQWVRDGFFVVPGAVPHQALDAVGDWMDRLVAAARPISGITLRGLQEAPGSGVFDMSHAAFLTRYPFEDRKRILAGSSWRILGLHRRNAGVRSIVRNPGLQRIASLVFQHDAVPSACIAFARGSAQALHQDAAVFHIQPKGFLFGCWIACEDIQADSGPLVYCPCSHRAPWFADFNNYPQTNLRTCDAATTARYNRWVAEESRRFERKRFLARKGDAFFWHSQLFHGGDAIARKDSTRKSLVIHYMVRGVNRGWAVRGPFNF
jgi:hypothetical protein